MLMRTAKKGLNATAVLLLGVSALSVHAGGLRFLNNTVLSDLTEQEISSFKSTIRTTLDQSPDATLIKWQSPTGKKAGKILPKFTYQSNGVACRRTLFQVSEVDGRKENYRFEVCKNESGWQIVASPNKLTKENHAQATAFLNKVLGQQETGHPASWVAADAKHSAVVVPLSEPENNCRNAAVSLQDNAGRRLDGQYRFCNKADSGWEYSPE